MNHEKSQTKLQRVSSKALKAHSSSTTSQGQAQARKLFSAAGAKTPKTKKQEGKKFATKSKRDPNKPRTFKRSVKKELSSNKEPKEEKAPKCELPLKFVESATEGTSEDDAAGETPVSAADENSPNCEPSFRKRSSFLIRRRKVWLQPCNFDRSVFLHRGIFRRTVSVELPPSEKLLLSAEDNVKSYWANDSLSDLSPDKLLCSLTSEQIYRKELSPWHTCSAPVTGSNAIYVRSETGAVCCKSSCTDSQLKRRLSDPSFKDKHLSNPKKWAQSLLFNVKSPISSTNYKVFADVRKSLMGNDLANTSRRQIAKDSRQASGSSIASLLTRQLTKEDSRQNSGSTHSSLLTRQLAKEDSRQSSSSSIASLLARQLAKEDSRQTSGSSIATLTRQHLGSSMKCSSGVYKTKTSAPPPSPSLPADKEANVSVYHGTDRPDVIERLGHCKENFPADMGSFLSRQNSGPQDVEMPVCRSDSATDSAGSNPLTSGDDVQKKESIMKNAEVKEVAANKSKEFTVQSNCEDEVQQKLNVSKNAEVEEVAANKSKECVLKSSIDHAPDKQEQISDEGEDEAKWEAKDSSEDGKDEKKSNKDENRNGRISETEPGHFGEKSNTTTKAPLNSKERFCRLQQTSSSCLGNAQQPSERNSLRVVQSSDQFKAKVKYTACGQAFSSSNQKNGKLDTEESDATTTKRKCRGKCQSESGRNKKANEKKPKKTLSEIFRALREKGCLVSNCPKCSQQAKSTATAKKQKNKEGVSKPTKSDKTWEQNAEYGAYSLVVNTQREESSDSLKPRARNQSKKAASLPRDPLDHFKGTASRSRSSDSGPHFETDAGKIKRDIRLFLQIKKAVDSQCFMSEDLSEALKRLQEDNMKEWRCMAGWRLRKFDPENDKQRSSRNKEDMALAGSSDGEEMFRARKGTTEREKRTEKQNKTSSSDVPGLTANANTEESDEKLKNLNNRTKNAAGESKALTKVPDASPNSPKARSTIKAAFKPRNKKQGAQYISQKRTRSEEPLPLAKIVLHEKTSMASLRNQSARPQGKSFAQSAQSNTCEARSAQQKQLMDLQERAAKMENGVIKDATGSVTKKLQGAFDPCHSNRSKRQFQHFLYFIPPRLSRDSRVKTKASIVSQSANSSSEMVSVTSQSPSTTISAGKVKRNEPKCNPDSQTQVSSKSSVGKCKGNKPKCDPSLQSKASSMNYIGKAKENEPKKEIYLQKNVSVVGKRPARISFANSNKTKVKGSEQQPDSSLQTVAAESKPQKSNDIPSAAPNSDIKNKKKQLKSMSIKTIKIIPKTTTSKTQTVPHTGVSEYFDMPEAINAEQLVVGDSLEHNPSHLVTTKEIKPAFPCRLKVSRRNTFRCNELVAASSSWEKDFSANCSSFGVKDICSSSNVKDICSSFMGKDICSFSNVKDICSTSKIKDICSSPNIKDIYSSPNAKDICSSPNAKDICFPPRTEDICSSNVKDVRSSSRVQDICSSSIVKDSCSSPSANDICSSSSVTDISSSPSVTDNCSSLSVKVIYSSSRVKDVCSSSKVKNIFSAKDNCSFSNVKDICSSSSVKDICSSSSVKDICSSSSVTDNRSSPRVMDISSSSRVKDVCSSFKVKDICSSSRVKDTCSSSRVKDVCSTSRIKDTCSAKEVCSSSRVKDVCSFSRVQDVVWNPEMSGTKVWFPDNATSHNLVHRVWIDLEI